MTTETGHTSARNTLRQSMIETQGRAFRENQWGARHTRQYDAVLTSPRGPAARRHGAGLVLMLEGWALWADTHVRSYGSVIGEDYVLGPMWAEIGRAMRGLLNGECGDLDCGTLDGLIYKILGDNGIDPEE